MINFLIIILEARKNIPETCLIISATVDANNKSRKEQKSNIISCTKEHKKLEGS